MAETKRTSMRLTPYDRSLIIDFGQGTTLTEKLRYILRNFKKIEEMNDFLKKQLEKLD